MTFTKFLVNYINAAFGDPFTATLHIVGIVVVYAINPSHLIAFAIGMLTMLAFLYQFER